MKIRVNGQIREVAEGASVGQLLAAFELEPVRVAVEVNEELVPRTTFQDHILSAGDQVEIVTFVGGG